MVIGACHEIILPRLFAGASPPALEVPPGFADRLVATVMSGIAPP